MILTKPGVHDHHEKAKKNLENFILYILNVAGNNMQSVLDKCNELCVESISHEDALVLTTLKKCCHLNTMCILSNSHSNRTITPMRTAENNVIKLFHC